MFLGSLLSNLARIDFVDFLERNRALSLLVRLNFVSRNSSSSTILSAIFAKSTPSTRSRNLLDVMMCLIPACLIACSIFMVPDVQLSWTGVFPAVRIPNDTSIAEHEAGSMTPIFSSGNSFITPARRTVAVFAFL